MAGGCRQVNGPEGWKIHHERSPREKIHEEHGSFLVDSSEHDEGTRDLSEEAGLMTWKSPQFAHAL